MVYSYCAVRSAGSFTRGLHRSGTHQGASRTGGLTKTKFASGVNNDSNIVRINTELVDSNLQCDGVDTLSHLGPAMANLNNPVSAEMHDCTTDFFETITETRVLQT